MSFRNNSKINSHRQSQNIRFKHFDTANHGSTLDYDVRFNYENGIQNSGEFGIGQLFNTQADRLVSDVQRTNQLVLQGQSNNLGQSCSSKSMDMSQKRKSSCQSVDRHSNANGYMSINQNYMIDIQKSNKRSRSSLNKTVSKSSLNSNLPTKRDCCQIKDNFSNLKLLEAKLLNQYINKINLIKTAKSRSNSHEKSFARSKSRSKSNEKRNGQKNKNRDNSPIDFLPTHQK